MIRERIKTETAKHHEAVESVGYSGQIMSGHLTLDEYKKLILTNLVLNRAFETQWNNLPFTLPTTLLLEQRRKTEALEQDAKILGVSIPQKSDITFPASSYATFLGTLYVFEGSTLGGAIIYKQLKTNTNLTDIEDFNFYTYYGEQLGSLWKVFLEHLTQLTDAEQIESAISAAKTTFDRTKDTFITINETAL